jgi:hypothetical protein
MDQYAAANQAYDCKTDHVRGGLSRSHDVALDGTTFPRAHNKAENTL